MLVIVVMMVIMGMRMGVGFGHGPPWGFREGGAAVKNTVLEIAGEETQTEGLLVDTLTDLAIGFMAYEAGSLLGYAHTLTFGAGEDRRHA